MPKGKPLGDVSDGKICPGCQQHKELGAFYKSKSFPSGYESYCKKCRNEKYERYRVRNKKDMARRAKEWRGKNPERARDLILRANYGIEIGTYDIMFAAQKGLCAICGTDKPGFRAGRFHVDHCHDSNKIRGLLCHNCNVGIGNLKHSEVILRSAIAYLNRTSQ